MDEWSRKFLEFMNVLLQMSQTNGLTSLCWLTWYLSWWLCLNALPHSAQINGLVSSSSSLLSRAIFSCVQVQNLHRNALGSFLNERVDNYTISTQCYLFGCPLTKSLCLYDDPLRDDFLPEASIHLTVTNLQSSYFSL